MSNKKQYDHEDENERELEIYSLSFDPNDPVTVEAFEEFMNAQQDEYMKEVDKLRDCLSLLYQDDITVQCANDVLYLRSRSRWSEANERELIRLHIAGTPPNIYEWP